MQELLEVYSLEKKLDNEKIACDCKVWAQVIKEKYSKPEDWYLVRLNNKIHFSYGTQSKPHIICKPKKYYYSDYI